MDLRAMELKDTVQMMESPDYKERFRGEYFQTKIRYGKLHDICVKYEAGTLDFEPACSLELLKEQKAAMGNYLRCLEIRAQIEGIDLRDPGLVALQNQERSEGQLAEKGEGSAV